VTIFIILSALLAALAAGLLVWPLLRPAGAQSAATPRAGIAATVVAAMLPLAAFVIYFAASNWSWDPAQQAAEPTMPDMQQMLAQLQERLASAPDDVEGWKMLGRSAAVVGDFVLAREAFGKAFTLTRGDDPDAMIGYAEALVANDEREIDGQAADLFERALVMAPDNARALWYGGIIAYRRGDLPLAQQRWVELQNHDLPPDLRQIVAERLADIEATQGKPPGPAAAATASPTPAVGGIPISIDVAPSLKAQLSPRATLFVIARRGEGGPPLAVVRRGVGAWPVSLTMSDADAMLPGTQLASGGPLRLIARISRSGQPVAVSGDLSGEVGYDFTSAHPASITIDRIVP